MVELAQLVASKLWTAAPRTAYLEGIRSIRELPIENKRVFIRVDFNVPLEGGEITDDSRIREALPTIKHALERGARVILASHLGRPEAGQDRGPLARAVRDCAWPSCSAPDVTLPEDCVGDAAKKVVYDLRAGQVVLLENLRFHPEEEKDDEGFCQASSRSSRTSTSTTPSAAVHRAHASVHAPREAVPRARLRVPPREGDRRAREDRRRRPRSRTSPSSAARR